MIKRHGAAVFEGVDVSNKPPEERRVWRKAENKNQYKTASAGTRPPLLRYPPGEAPINRGVCRPEI
jgi:hypothetical protein